MQRTLLINILKYGIFVLCLSSVGQWLRIPIGPTALWWGVYSLIIWALIRTRDKTYNSSWLVLWVIYVVISSVIGAALCRDYWDVKLLLGNVFGYAICMATLAAYDPQLLQQIFGFLYKHIWKLFVVLMLFLSSDGIAKFMIPFSFLALFYPLLNAKSRWYMYGGLLITLIFGYECRTDVIKYLFCAAIGLFSVRHEIAQYARRWYWLFYILPVLLFILAANGTFNVFSYAEGLSLNEDNSAHIQTADTRTALYEDVITTSLDRGTIWFGNTPARGYHSNWVIHVDDKSDLLGDEHYGERGTTESSVLNVFLHFGVIGLFIYMVLFGYASYLSIFRSNNIYLPIIGLCVAFRFMIGWVEDFSRFDLNMFFLWAMIGMCYSPYFREQSDDEFIEWFNGILV